MRLANRIAIVTGAGSGFGAAIAKLFAQEGAKVCVADLNGETAERVAGEIGASAIAVQGDVTKQTDIERMVAETEAAFGPVDTVVNNAGYTHKNQPMLQVGEAEFDKVFDVNVKSIYLMTMAVVPKMRERGFGVIVNVGSTAGVRPRPGLTWYNASKGAVNLLSQSMAVELAPDGIRVNALAPVMGETGLLESFMGVPDTPENRKKFEATVPMGRLSRPEDIAKATLYLASDEADFITGTVLPVDGGRCV
ncbi:SDR family oxidoreductase [Rhodovibrio salinarum]|uniref:3-oxoacyl-ACP reductase n=1 Tax=Rhodovibrio salinarum TaxID=1087 RepID=A0A934QK13_9PROT|nr:SDR family oxidoreductase [Rhodovibrio salinarum]MBK1698573.1 3-oxoacyl-ACP reductase [Rhodovibrio salinarum]